MQKNVFSYAIGVAALSLLCSCGTCKKDEVKVDVKDQAPIEQKSEAAKELAQNEVPTTPGTEATPAEVTPATEATPAEATPVEENKAA